MSNLRLSNIQSNGTGFNDVVSFQNASGTENGTLCRGWVYFNGTGTIAILADFNVDSIDDGGTGYYKVNWTNSFPTNAYCSIVSGTTGGTGGGNVSHDSQLFGGGGTNAPLAGSITLRAVDGTGNSIDHAWVTAAVFY
jgi:hypothetical protein